ncbi:hypothetical protein NQ318_014686 [Aromia moschata]|uniref:Uncharacterized protein n=1 Tax=Aromia moschata TaxID=1265417 RepID=A0AAV8ZDI4_9CUCU|nr:hypothetical protein NQ318_014686 [Aromia moschata]
MAEEVLLNKSALVANFICYQRLEAYTDIIARMSSNHLLKYGVGPMPPYKIQACQIPLAATEDNLFLTLSRRETDESATPSAAVCAARCAKTVAVLKGDSGLSGRYGMRAQAQKYSSVSVKNIAHSPNSRLANVMKLCVIL